jgi:hypothetical protein
MRLTVIDLIAFALAVGVPGAALAVLFYKWIKGRLGETIKRSINN